MTISSEVRKAGPYVGNGVTTAFPFAFKVFTASDVLVILTDLSGVETTLAGADYGVALSANQESSPGGTVTKASPLVSNYLLTITSRVPTLQPLDLTNHGGFYPKVINAAFDRLTILVQQTEETVSRAVTVPISSGLTPDELKDQLFAVSDSAAASADNAAGYAAAAVSANAGANSAKAAAQLASANAQSFAQQAADTAAAIEAELNKLVVERVDHAASTALTPEQLAKLNTNIGAPGHITFILPPAVPGVGGYLYRSPAYNSEVRLSPTLGDRIAGGDPSRLGCLVTSGLCMLDCIEAGVWTPTGGDALIAIEF